MSLLCLTGLPDRLWSGLDPTQLHPAAFRALVKSDLLSSTVCVTTTQHCSAQLTRSMVWMLCCLMASMWVGLLRMARIPPWTPGCRVFTRPGGHKAQVGQRLALIGGHVPSAQFGTLAYGSVNRVGSNLTDFESQVQEVFDLVDNSSQQAHRRPPPQLANSSASCPVAAQYIHSHEFISSIPAHPPISAPAATNRACTWSRRSAIELCSGVHGCIVFVSLKAAAAHRPTSQGSL